MILCPAPTEVYAVGGVQAGRWPPFWALSHSQAIAPRAAATLPKDANPGDSVVAEPVEQRTEPPSLYQVILLNDDFTPMEFVVAVLQQFFNKDHDTAVQIMLTVHVHGRGVCGVYTRDVAATKVDQVLSAARKAGHPLQCLMERVD